MKRSRRSCISDDKNHETNEVYRHLHQHCQDEFAYFCFKYGTYLSCLIKSRPYNFNIKVTRGPQTALLKQSNRAKRFSKTTTVRCYQSACVSCYEQQSG